MEVFLIYAASSLVAVSIWPKRWVAVVLALILFGISIYGYVCCTLPEYYLGLLIPSAIFCALFGAALFGVIWLRLRIGKRP